MACIYFGDSFLDVPSTSQDPFLGSDFMFDVGSMKSISRITEGTCIGSKMCAYI